jgi:hypothetical protein
MKNRIISTIIALIGFYSCQSSESVGDDFTYKINIDNAETNKTSLPISDLCDDVETIILETTHGSLLSTPSKVINVNDRLYVFDRFSVREGVVMEFDMDGKFIKRFGMVGRGPGEYIRISDFAVDEKNNTMYLLDQQTRRIISYELGSGKYIEDISVTNNDYHSTSIVSVGEFIYTTLKYRKFDKSNYMLSSFNKADPGVENYYLPIDDYLKGWTDTKLASNSNIIFNHGNDYALYSDKLSPEIIKLTGDGISSYIYIESEDFIDETGRMKLSGVVVSSDAYHQTLFDLSCFTEIRNYFETDRYICFWINREGFLYQFIYDKVDEKVKRQNLDIDPIVKIQDGNAHFPVLSLFQFVQADANGIFYVVYSQNIDKLRTAAREGMLVENLDRLDELKQLSDDSNPVIFYVKFKNPLK